MTIQTTVLLVSFCFPSILALSAIPACSSFRASSANAFRFVYFRYFDCVSTAASRGDRLVCENRSTQSQMADLESARWVQAYHAEKRILLGRGYLAIILDISRVMGILFGQVLRIVWIFATSCTYRHVLPCLWAVVLYEKIWSNMSRSVTARYYSKVHRKLLGRLSNLSLNRFMYVLVGTSIFCDFHGNHRGPVHSRHSINYWVTRVIVHSIIQSIDQVNKQPINQHTIWVPHFKLVHPA